VAVALLVRGSLFAMAARDARRFFTLDAAGYLALAGDLASGYLRRETPLFTVGLSRTPGYPVFAAAVLLPTGRPAAVVAVQILTAAATVWLTFRLGQRLVGRRAAALGALVLALDPASAIYANQLQPEALFTLLVVGTLLAWARAVRTRSATAAALAGACLGLAALTRPIAVYFPLVLIGWAARATGRSKLVASLMTPFLLLVGGWIARNGIVTGVPLLSTIEGTNMLDYRAAGTLARVEGIPIEEARVRLRDRLRVRVAPDANPAQVSRAQTRLAFEAIGEHPRAFLEVTAVGAARLAAGNGLTALSRLRGDEDPETVRGVGKVMAAAVLTLALALVYAAALRGALVLWRDGRRCALTLLAATVAYFGLIAAGPEANTRFRVPAVPFLALLAGAGCTSRLTREAPFPVPVEDT
jgi:Dolichyl-phosphate-mannose-protein mannosyltransferase